MSNREVCYFALVEFVPKITIFDIKCNTMQWFMGEKEPFLGRRILAVSPPAMGGTQAVLARPAGLSPLSCCLLPQPARSPPRDSTGKAPVDCCPPVGGAFVGPARSLGGRGQVLSSPCSCRIGACALLSQRRPGDDRPSVLLRAAFDSKCGLKYSRALESCY